jgi:hypothetical protein
MEESKDKNKGAMYAWTFPPENAIEVDSKGLQKLLVQIGRTLEEHQQAIDTPPWLDKIERMVTSFEHSQKLFYVNYFTSNAGQKN